MEPQSPEAMTQFLAPTRLCDSDTVEVKGKASELTAGIEDPTQAALSIFYFVRDKIAFGLYFPDVKASETLAHGTGFCMTKTNLQMALLRAAGIPSRCHLVRLPKEVNRAITPKFFYDRTPELIVHPWCECYLDGRWASCDSVLDEPFYRSMLKKGHISAAEMPSIDWDGRTDLIFGKPLIKEDLGTFPSWDEGIEDAKKKGGVPPTNRFLGPLVFALANRRIKELRTS